MSVSTIGGLKNVLTIDLRGKTTNIDLSKVLSVYNFKFWFNGEYGFLIVDEERPVIAQVSINGMVKIYSGEALSGDEERNVISKVEHMLGLNEDLSEFFSMCSRDPLLKGFARTFRGWRLRATSLWWSLVIGVCQQNASFRQGWKMLYNIIKIFGDKVTLENRKIPIPPTPSTILKFKDKLKLASIGYRDKVLVNIAKSFLDGEISESRLLGLNASLIEKELLKIKGVGPYTARLAIALTFRNYELPPIDRWLRRLASLAYNVSEIMVEKEWSKRWRRWAGLAAIATTIALDAEPLRRAIERFRRGLLIPLNPDYPTPTNLWKFESP